MEYSCLELAIKDARKFGGYLVYLRGGVTPDEETTKEIKEPQFELIANEGFCLLSIWMSNITSTGY